MSTRWISSGDCLRGWTLLGAWALLVLTPGCGDEARGGTDASEEPLLVMAAASLNEAMPDLIERFRSSTGTPADLALGSTGNLAAQIENGAPADVFFSADEATVARLVSSGAIEPASVRTYAVGRLAAVWRRGAPRPAALDDIADSRYEVIAIANPELAPYGAAAREALQRLGIWRTIEGRVVMGENVSQTYQLVQTGNVDVALIARSVISPTTEEYLLVDPALHAPIRHGAGIVERSAHPAAGEFLDFVLSDQGQAILAEHGFGSAPD